MICYTYCLMLWQKAIANIPSLFPRSRNCPTQTPSSTRLQVQGVRRRRHRGSVQNEEGRDVVACNGGCVVVAQPSRSHQGRRRRQRDPPNVGHEKLGGRFEFPEQPQSPGIRRNTVKEQAGEFKLLFRIRFGRVLVLCNKKGIK